MIRVQREDFDIAAEVRRIAEGDAGHDVGAIVTFTGTVRRASPRGTLKAMTLEHYPGMTERELERIRTEAHRRWSLSGSTIIHRYGRLVPGDNIVLVVTASPHREAAFEAAQFLMDFLKTDAPFWKSEETEAGDQSWVEAKSSDDAARARWHR